MSSLKDARGMAVFAPRPFHDLLRRLGAVSLRYASRALVRLSRRLERTAAAGTAPVPYIEFYAEPGAAEGALYLNGELVGRVRGIRRL
jgi:hypothetical protein